jgi:hypothetical protein
LPSETFAASRTGDVAQSNGAMEALLNEKLAGRVLALVSLRFSICRRAH